MCALLVANEYLFSAKIYNKDTDSLCVDELEASVLELGSAG
jgi:hypothetical protein